MFDRQIKRGASIVATLVLATTAAVTATLVTASPVAAAAPAGSVVVTESAALSPALQWSYPAPQTVSLTGIPGNEIVLTVAFFRPLSASDTMAVGNAPGQAYPDPAGSKLEPSWTKMVPLGSFQLITCTLSLNTSSYEVACNGINTTYNYWSTILDETFQVQSAYTYSWQVSAVPTPQDPTLPNYVRRIGRTLTSNKFPAYQCTWGAQQLVKQNTGTYMNVTGNANTWGTAANPYGWYKPASATPQSRTVAVVNTASPGHVFWVQAVQYSGDYVYLHLIEMNNASYPNKWVFTRRLWSQAGYKAFIYIP